MVLLKLRPLMIGKTIKLKSFGLNLEFNGIIRFFLSGLQLHCDININNKN